jgi:nucleotide-binding universal stress UspA family protein
MPSHDDQHLLVGYDGSPDAAGAIELGARLFPARRARIAHLWAPPFAATELRARVWRQGQSVNEMIDLLEREALAEAERVAGEGVTLATAAGWTAEPLLKRTYGGEGLELAALAAELLPAVLVVGSRGLTGVRGVLGSVSDEAVHASPVPVLVVPRLVLSAERAMVASGSIVVGDDGSAGSARARDAATALFRDRRLLTVRVQFDDDPEAPTGPDTVTVPPLGVATSGRAIGDAIVRQADAAGAAAIVVGSRGRSAAREIMLGSVAMSVLHHADRPVIVVPAGKAKPAAV